MNKLIPLSRIRAKKDTSDSVKARLAEKDGDKQNPKLLQRAENSWISLSKLRDRRERNYNYVYIDQWSDWVRDEKGNLVRERERVAKRTGGVALQNNHLIKIIHSLTGLYAKQATEPIVFSRTPGHDEAAEIMTGALQTNWENEQMRDVLVSEMAEMLYGGMPVVYEDWCRNLGDEEEDSHTIVVEPSHFFFESSGIDPRHRDIDLIGHFEDYSEPKLFARFAKSKYDQDQLREIYAPYRQWTDAVNEQQTDKLKNPVWDRPNGGDCRVYNIWTVEHKLYLRCWDPMDIVQPLYHIDPKQKNLVELENERRIAQAAQMGMPLDDVPVIEYKPLTYTYWHYQALAPGGLILEEYDSPFETQEHPYTFKCFEYVSGDVVPFISSVIDQQRYINRLITLFDLMIQASAKGVTMIPKSIVPKNMTESEFARSIRDLGGYLFYDDKNGKSNARPEIVTSNSNMVGLTEMLQLQLNFIPEITNVSDSLQGKSPGSSVAASRYAMETQNSTTSVSSLLLKFDSFANEVANKKMRIIHQHYKTGRDISVHKSNGYSEYMMYDKLKTQDVKFATRIEMAPENPVYRMAINDVVAQMWQQGAIDAMSMLKMSYLPGSSQVVKQLEKAQQAMQAQANAMQQQAGAPGGNGMSEAMQQAVTAQDADPAAMQQGRPYVRGKDVDAQTAM